MTNLSSIISGSIVKHPLFLTALAIKITLAFFFASPHLTQLFIPFIDYFVESGFTNPYEQFSNSSPQSFPYPTGMLAIMAIPKIFFSVILTAFPLSPEVNHWDAIIYRIPLLAADIALLWVFMEWFKEDKFKLLLTVWASPVLTYISYVHGQLDAIPIALAFLSFHFMFRGKLLVSAFVLGLSLSTKTHIFAVLPFILVFLTNRQRGISNPALFTLVSLGTFTVINLPYLGNSSFTAMVFTNNEQAKVWDAAISAGEMGPSFLIIPACGIVLGFQFLFLRKLNRDLFMMFLGFVFTLLLIFIPPKQGWYFWIIPFIVYFSARTYRHSRAHYLLWALQGTYFFYFATLPRTEGPYTDNILLFDPLISLQEFLASYLSSNSLVKLNNLAFTSLQTCLALSSVAIYQVGIRQLKGAKIFSTPFMLGIAGDSGAGKSTLTDAISQIFGNQNTTILRGDDMHKWERGHDQWKELTHLDPRANHLHQEVHELSLLKQGRKIQRRHYDHSDGRFSKAKVIRSNNLVIVEGLLSFYLQSQRNLYDLKIFIRPNKELIKHFKICRDQSKRKYDREKILQQIEQRQKDSNRYLQPQSEHADILIEASCDPEQLDVGNPNCRPELSYSIQLRNSLFVEDLLKQLAEVPKLRVIHEYTSTEHQKVQLEGQPSYRDLSPLAGKYLSSLNEFGSVDLKPFEGCFGALLLIVTHAIFLHCQNDTSTTRPHEFL